MRVRYIYIYSFNIESYLVNLTTISVYHVRVLLRGIHILLGFFLGCCQFDTQFAVCFSIWWLMQSGLIALLTELLQKISKWSCSLTITKTIIVQHVVIMYCYTSIVNIWNRGKILVKYTIFFIIGKNKLLLDINWMGGISVDGFIWNASFKSFQ